MDASPGNRQRNGEGKTRACCRCLEVGCCCEPYWRRAPLRRCCCCIGPIRRGALIAAVATAMLMLFVMVPVLSILRGRTFFDNKGFTDYQKLPFTVLLLRHLYFVMLIWSLVCGLMAVNTFGTLGFGGTKPLVPNYTICPCIPCYKCPISFGLPPPLAMSRVMRIGLYFYVVALCFIHVSSVDICLPVGRAEEYTVWQQACACQGNNGTWTEIVLGGQGTCSPKRYFLCEAPADNPILTRQCQACGLHAGLLAGEAVPTGNHTTCTLSTCTTLGCSAALHVCPARKSDFQHSLESGGHMLEHLTYWDAHSAGTDECQYDGQGRLTSLQFISRNTVRDAFDDYLGAGVLRLVEGGQDFEESLNELVAGIRGTSNFSFTQAELDDVGTTAGLNSTVVAADCRIEVEAELLRLSRLRNTCERFITTWTILFCLIGVVVHLHFSRVFFSVWLNLTAKNEDKEEDLNVSTTIGLPALEMEPMNVQVAGNSRGLGENNEHRTDGGLLNAEADTGFNSPQPRPGIKTVVVPEGTESAGFTCNDKLEITRLDDECLAVDAGAIVGMQIVSFQSRPLPPSMTWAALKSAARQTPKPWHFGFEWVSARRPPSPTPPGPLSARP